MPRRKYTPQNIFDMIKRSENGEVIRNICTDYGMSPQNFSKMKKEYMGMSVKQMDNMFKEADSEAQIKRIKAAEENKKNPPKPKPKKKYKPPEPDPYDAKYTITIGNKVNGAETLRAMIEAVKIGLIRGNYIAVISKESPKLSVKILRQKDGGCAVSLIKSGGETKTRTFTAGQISDPAEAIAAIACHLS